MKLFFGVLVVLLLVVVSVGVYTFIQACVRKKEPQWMCEDAIKKTGYAKFYNCILASNAWLESHHAQDVYVKSKDGLRLHGYWIPAENARGTVLLAHGYRSTVLVDFGLAFAFYHALGMNLLVPQQRAHGESEGKYITFGVKESDDMACWIHYHNHHFGEYQMVLSGLSMGASTMLYLADRNLPENVKCIIADCGFTSPADIIDKVFRSVVHIPPGPVLWVVNLFAKLLAGFGLNEKDSREILKDARVPVMLIHGLADDFVPCEMTRQAFDSCPGEKEILLVENAGHGTSFLKDKESYTKCIIAFLEKHLEDF